MSVIATSVKEKEFNFVGSPTVVSQRQQLSRRSKLETYCDILKVVAAGATKPTHVMYKANLSWKILVECIEQLKQRGLLEDIVDKDDGNRTFRLTSKGFTLVKQYLEVKESFLFE